MTQYVWGLPLLQGLKCKYAQRVNMCAKLFESLSWSNGRLFLAICMYSTEAAVAVVYFRVTWQLTKQEMTSQQPTWNLNKLDECINGLTGLWSDRAAATAPGPSTTPLQFWVLPSVLVRRRHTSSSYSSVVRKRTDFSSIFDIFVLYFVAYISDRFQSYPARESGRKISALLDIGGLVKIK